MVSDDRKLGDRYHESQGVTRVKKKTGRRESAGPECVLGVLDHMPLMSPVTLRVGAPVTASATIVTVRTSSSCTAKVREPSALTVTLTSFSMTKGSAGGRTCAANWWPLTSAVSCATASVALMRT